MQTTRIIAGVLAAALALGTLAPLASAQGTNAQAAPKQPQRPILLDPYNRGPPPPPDRPWPPPRSEVSPPMPRTPSVAPLSPRVGN